MKSTTIKTLIQSVNRLDYIHIYIYACVRACMCVCVCVCVCVRACVCVCVCYNSNRTFFVDIVIWDLRAPHKISLSCNTLQNMVPLPSPHQTSPSGTGANLPVRENHQITPTSASPSRLVADRKSQYDSFIWRTMFLVEGFL